MWSVESLCSLRTPMSRGLPRLQETPVTARSARRSVPWQRPAGTVPLQHGPELNQSEPLLDQTPLPTQEATRQGKGIPNKRNTRP